MVKIKRESGRQDEFSGYGRVFGHVPLGQLFSQIQACVISAGTELEQILVRRSPYSMSYAEYTSITFTSESSAPQTVVLHKLPKIERKQRDLLVLHPISRQGVIVEVKEGDTFDTKKSDGEKERLSSLAEYYSQTLRMSISYALSSFYVASRSQITIGTKGRFTNDHALTGRELCALIDVDYQAVVEERKADQVYNMNYFLEGLLALPDVRALIEDKIAARSQEGEV